MEVLKTILEIAAGVFVGVETSDIGRFFLQRAQLKKALAQRASDIEKLKAIAAEPRG